MTQSQVLMNLSSWLAESDNPAARDLLSFDQQIADSPLVMATIRHLFSDGGFRNLRCRPAGCAGRNWRRQATVEDRAAAAAS